MKHFNDRKQKLSEFKSRKLGVGLRDNSEARNDSEFKKWSQKTTISRKEAPEKEEENQESTFASRNPPSSSPPPLGSLSKKAKTDRRRSFDAVPASTTTSEA
ncbi:hypothetical protein B9Z55_000598 [Caenorhabditis nigoni]|uniref:Uncharacterized protein n=1 Tax=Caenorhabditis nigoni TaxID=1611254 RepID=A0A2G5VTZ3_9PELO|nr:hypothetical protein B9Z55_000598 [Caenorhabditis nigoni]